ncbi:hypothetical protein [Solitalea lacus]|uniref:hypothetical protein n=1 Tax=Solitalea lacus TaxID=2911172 RepID=UPI001EDB1F26|nr:hypothetical protein [Solitalea lacus]UKJ06691.1 hypothetical protein L2B55_14280 [Solitalea lacus]
METMKKILLAVNALDFKTSTLDFAAFIAKLTIYQLTGIFLEKKAQETTPKPVNEMVDQNGRRITNVEETNGKWGAEEKHKIRDWLKPHYSNVVFDLNGDVNKELFHYFIGKRNVFVEMGAYVQSANSYFFQPRKAELLIKTLNLPIFISHY